MYRAWRQIAKCDLLHDCEIPVDIVFFAQGIIILSVLGVNNIFYHAVALCTEGFAEPSPSVGPECRSSEQLDGGNKRPRLQNPDIDSLNEPEVR